MDPVVGGVNLWQRAVHSAQKNLRKVPGVFSKCLFHGTGYALLKVSEFQCYPLGLMHAVARRRTFNKKMAM